MPANYHSKICAITHNAMEQLFAAGLVHPDNMVEFDLLCRKDVAGAPDLAEKRHEAAPPGALDLPTLLRFNQPPPVSEPKLETRAAQPQRAEAKAATATYVAAAMPQATLVAGAPRPMVASATQAPTKAAQSAPAKASPAKPPYSKPQQGKPKQASAQAPQNATRPKKPRASLLTSLPTILRPQTAAKKQGPATTAPASAAVARPKAVQAEFSPRPAASALAPELRPSVLPPETAPPMAPAEIRTLREREGVSEAVFARCLEVPLQTVIAWEAGQEQPSPLNLRRLHQAASRGLHSLN